MKLLNLVAAGVALTALGTASVEGAAVRAATPQGHVPDLYVKCANEGGNCQCNGVVVLGSPAKNLWSEPAKATGTLKCAASSFPATLPAPNRECWCKDKAQARKADYPPEQKLVLGNVPYTTTKPKDGMEWKSAEAYPVFGKPQSFDVILVDTKKRKMGIAFSEAQLKKTSVLAEEVGATAAVNGGFHAYGRNIGSVTMLKVDGKQIVDKNTVEEWDLQSEDVEGVLCFDKNGAPRIVSAAADESVWRSYPTYIHTGPLLVLDNVRQPLDHKTWNHVSNPRTAICVMKDGRGMMLTVDGRHPNSGGMTLPELAQFMQALGCKDAINLDGGGSTTMVVSPYGMVNEPRDKPRNGEAFDTNLTERGVSNAVIVV